MPKFEIVQLIEAQTKTSTGKSRVILECLDMIKQSDPGQAGKVIPDEGETTQAIKRRLSTAAKLAGINLTVKKADDGVYFWVGKRGRGRPKKIRLDG